MGGLAWSQSTALVSWKSFIFRKKKPHPFFSEKRSPLSPRLRARLKLRITLLYAITGRPGGGKVGIILKLYPLFLPAKNKIPAVSKARSPANWKQSPYKGASKKKLSLAFLRKSQPFFFARPQTSGILLATVVLLRALNVRRFCKVRGSPADAWRRWLMCCGLWNFVNFAKFGVRPPTPDADEGDLPLVGRPNPPPNSSENRSHHFQTESNSH